MGKRKKQSSAWPALLVLLCLGAVGFGYLSSKPQPGDAPEATPAARSDSASLRIASWNIRQLGGRASTDLRMIARVIVENDFDVVAIQEVQRDGRGVDRLLNELGPPWRGTRLGSESRSGERLTFIYRGDRVSELSTAANLTGASPSVFERVPYVARFRAGNFDCEVVTVHLSWGDVAQRQNEMKTLATLVEKRTQSQAEKDVIVVGDFNEQTSRPNLLYMAAAGWATVIKDRTNLSSKETYDHILINDLHTREYRGKTGVVRFDESMFENNDDAAADAVSDHRPVWADFALDMPDDD